MSSLLPPVASSERVIGEADIHNLYRVFLSREPEGGAPFARMTGQSLAAAIADLIARAEFRQALAIVDGTAIVGRTMLTRLSGDLIDWVGDVAAANSIGDDRPRDRLTAVRTLLRTKLLGQADRIGQSIAVDPVHEIETALEKLDDAAEQITSSGLFDEAYYLAQMSEDERIDNAPLHYLLFGEKAGLAPSHSFDPQAYANLHGDVAASDINRLLHYERYGRVEGRRHRDWYLDHVMPPVTNANGLPTILLLLHEATYTGAPILGWNLAGALSEFCNVVVVLRRGGALQDALGEVAAALVGPPPEEATADAAQMDGFAQRLVAAYQPLYVLANSTESAPIAVALSRHLVPIVGLVHEFWPGATPAVRSDFYAGCAALVFPAEIVERSSLHAFRETALQTRVILRQGASLVPAVRSRALAAYPAPFDKSGASLDGLLGDSDPGSVTVIGLGAVEMRKGIDLFLSTATTLRAKRPDLAFRFIWIGSWEHAIGSQYARLLEEQYHRSSSETLVYFFPAVDDLNPIYDNADILFLCSRLDPLPNVAIDAAFRSIPIVCFDQASGLAELMTQDPDTATMVAPYLDLGGAADRLAALAQDVALRHRSGEAIERLARRSFDMKSYAAHLDSLGRQARRKIANCETDKAIIAASGLLDAPLYFAGSDLQPLGYEDAVAAYIDGTRHIDFASPAVSGVILRRPMAGFHPFIYGSEAADFPRDGSRDPLAHFLERDMPQGRWMHRVIEPSADVSFAHSTAPALGDASTSSRRAEDAAAPVALHGHFHYTDDIDEFLHAVSANSQTIDLYLTTNSLQNADILSCATQGYRRGRVDIEIVPNIGRDIFAFARVLQDKIVGAYDVVGHVHGKRTVHTQVFDPDYGERWRRFLWEHLLGPAFPMADRIVDAIRQDGTLGLVFPENGYLIGWEENGPSAELLAARMGLKSGLPSHIEFPAGTMFWARVDALRLLAGADLQAREMPAEPIPIDGTLLHSLERMLPLLCDEAGYGYATTYIPTIQR